MALPALLTLYLAFHAGGFYAATPALVALVLGQVLLLRVMGAEHPLAGYSRGLTIACGALALFGLWGLASSGWSHAPGRALVEFDRVLMYLVVLVVFGSVRWTESQVRWMVRLLALAAVGVCATALLSRVAPDVLATSPNLADNRLSYPVTYWNSLGLIAALGAVLCLWLAADESGGRWVRALGAGGGVIAVCTLYFTFSRGAIAAGAIGVLVFAVIGRPRGLVPALLALSLPATAALLAAYRASLLAGLDPTSAAATRQGHHVAAVVGACVVAAAALRLALAVVLDRRLAAIELPVLSARTRLGLAGAALLAVAAVALATGAPGRIGDAVDTFVHSNPASGTDDLRVRLSDPSNRARIDHWGVALRTFAAAPLRGTGLGTYENQWALGREEAFSVVNAHSLYLETISDLGIVGGLLLLAALGSILFAFARRARDRDGGRVLYAAMLGCAVAWALGAGVDWHWQMPATTLWLFALGGVALSARPSDPVRPAAASERWRLPAGVACLALLITPALMTVSQSRVHRAIDRFEAGDCPGARSSALAAISTLDVSPLPYEVLGHCDLQDGYPGPAVAAMRKAVALDPANWEASYGLALTLAADGADPRDALARARRQNPREPLLRAAEAGLAGRETAARRRAWARSMWRALVNSGRLSI